MADQDYHPLLAAVVRQAIQDLTHTDIRSRLDALMFFAAGDYSAYADALHLPADGLEILRTGKVRELVANEKAQTLREYNRDKMRAWRRKNG